MRFTKQPIQFATTLALLLSFVSGSGCSFSRLNRTSHSAAIIGDNAGEDSTTNAARSSELGKRSAAKLPAAHLPPTVANRDLASISKRDATVNFASAQIIAAEPLENQEPSIEVASQVSLEVDDAVAQPNHPVLTLELLQQMALSQNPALLQAAATVDQARGIHYQVGLKPNPTLGYFGQEIGNEGTGGQHGGFVSQTWIRGDKLAWNRRVLAHEISASNWQTQVQQQRVLTDLQISYFDVLSAQRRLQLAEDFRSLAKKSVELATDKLKATVGTRPDLLQSEIQLSEIDLVIQQARIDHSAALQRLAALCGVTDLGDAIVTGDFDTVSPSGSSSALDQEALIAELYATSPELALAQAQIDRACASLNRQKLQPISNVTTQLGIAADDATGDAFTNIQLSVPVPVHNRNQGNIRAAAAAYHAAIQNAERIRSRLRSDLAQSLGESLRAKAVVDNYRDRILPKAREAMELIQEGKEAGEFDFLRELTARRVFFDSNLRFVSAQAELAQARAKIRGKLLTGGLTQDVRYQGDDGLRGQALNGQ